MKKQFLLPLFAVLLAVSGAFASSRFDIGYYASTDFECEFPLEVEGCTPGEGEPCINEDDQNQLRYKLDKDDPGSPCDDLFREVGSKK